VAGGNYGWLTVAPKIARQFLDSNLSFSVIVPSKTAVLEGLLQSIKHAQNSLR
jgi:hypothetical protein